MNKKSHSTPVANMRLLRNALRFLAFLAFTSLLLGCSSATEETDPMDDATEEVKSECQKLPEAAQRLCINVIEKRISYYLQYLNRSNGYITDLNEQHEAALQEVRALQEKCGPSNQQACDDIRVMEDYSVQMAERHETELAMQEAAASGVIDALVELPQLLANWNMETEVICQARDIGIVDCVSLESLLAYYDTEMNIAIIQDIARLYEVLEIDHRIEILLGCGPGVWGDAGLLEIESEGGSESPILSGFVPEETASSMLDQCLEITSSLEDKAAELSSSGGFSGITGFDTLGFGPCGAGLEGGLSSFDRVMEQFWEISKALRQNCSTSLIDSLAQSGSAEDPEPSPTPEAPSPPTPPPPPPEDTDPDNPPVTENPDGSKTKVEIHTDDDGKKVKIETKTDENGNVKQVKVTTWYPDGRTKSSSKSYDSNGNPFSSLDQTWFPNGDYWEHSAGPEGSYDYVHEDQTGDTVFHSPGGIWMWDIDGNIVLDWGSCVDEACNTCKDWASLMPDVYDDCVKSGGRSYTCQAFGDTADCCSNPDAFPGDPRLILPNQNGDFTCYGGADPNWQQEACEQRCGVASREEDCNSNCMESQSIQVEFSVLDMICQEAILEACFSSSNGILGPTGPGGEVVGGIQPLPLPELTLFEGHLLIPYIDPSIPGMPGIDPDRPTEGRDY